LHFALSIGSQITLNPRSRPNIFVGISHDENQFVAAAWVHAHHAPVGTIIPTSTSLSHHP